MSHYSQEMQNKRYRRLMREETYKKAVIKEKQRKIQELQKEIDELGR